MWSGRYRAFGQADTVALYGFDNQLRFPGQRAEDATELHYNFKRYYDPDTGRYASSDPIGLQGGLNSYSYVFANPLIWYDPNGLSGEGLPINPWKFFFDAVSYSKPAGKGSTLTVNELFCANLVQSVHEQAEYLMQTQSLRARGPVLSGIQDLATNEIFYGQNTGVPSDLHHVLRARLETLIEQTDGQGLGKGIPGAHLEINALNQAFHHREAMGIAVTEESLKDFIFYNVRLRGATKGQPIQRCRNCACLTSGANCLSD